MRPPSFATFFRTFTLTNLTRSFYNHHPLPRPHTLSASTARIATFRSMPTLPFIGSLFSSSSSAQNKADMADFPVQKSNTEWQAVLSPEQFRIIRQKGTEAPGSGEYNKHYPSAGLYVRLHHLLLIVCSSILT